MVKWLQVLETAFAETEALVNSRPLTEFTSCSSDFEAITPNHLFISRANPMLPCGVFADKEISSKKRWRQVQVLINQVWSKVVTRIPTHPYLLERNGIRAHAMSELEI